MTVPGISSHSKGETGFICQGATVSLLRWAVWGRHGVFQRSSFCLRLPLSCTWNWVGGALLGHLSRGRKSKRDLSHLRFPQQQQQKSPLILWWLGGKDVFKGSQEDRRYTGFPEANVTSRLSHALPWRQNKVLGRRAGTLSSGTSSNTWASRTGDVSVP